MSVCEEASQQVKYQERRGVAEGRGWGHYTPHVDLAFSHGREAAQGAPMLVPSPF